MRHDRGCQASRGDTDLVHLGSGRKSAVAVTVTLLWGGISGNSGVPLFCFGGKIGGKNENIERK